MQFELVWRAFVTLPKIIIWKIKYNSRLSIPLVQSLDKNFTLRIAPKGKVSIGKELVCRNNTTLRVEDGELSIGDKCFFNSNVSITCMEEITIGNGCQIANNVVIVDHDHDYRSSLSNFTKEKVTIGNHVWIGANCVILKGATIGDNCVIAAGSIVKGSVEANTLYYQKREAICKKIIDERQEK